MSALRAPSAFAAALLVLLVGLPGLLPEGTARHVDAPGADIYTAESLTSARFAIGAVEERFLGRPFWIEPLTGRGVRVGIIDTGIDPTHPDLEGSIVAWRDFLNGRPEPYDDDTHGTHVAGIVAAHGHFQPRPDRHYFPFGARGVAPGAQLVVAKAMDRAGDGDATDVAAAILWTLDPNGDGDRSDGADVINLSIGLELPPDTDGPTLPGPVTLPTVRPRSADETRIVEEAIRTAVRAGAVVVVAAGNHEPGAEGHVTFPGTLREVITVGALDGDGRLARFSNHGGAPGKPELSAPGILLSTFPTGRELDGQPAHGYVALGGTSMAAPLVAGAVALLMEADPTLRGLSSTEDRSARTETIRSILTSTATPVAGAPGGAGAGRLSVADAVAGLDDGRGPPNWDVLFTLFLLLALGVGLAVWRRRRAAQRERVRRLTEEARRRIAAADAGDGTSSVGMAAQTRPDWQTAPWDRPTRP